jgi:hypothetical protein
MSCQNEMYLPYDFWLDSEQVFKYRDPENPMNLSCWGERLQKVALVFYFGSSAEVIYLKSWVH